MSSRKIGDIKITYASADTKTADLVAEACEGAIRQTAEDWGLKVPANCQIHVMTSWFNFVWNSTPPRWKFTLALTTPLWVPRIRKTWPSSIAWTQRFGSRIAIGIKPARLVETGERAVGSLMYVKQPDQDMSIKTATCHELIHASAVRRVLPTWLDEGIAIYSTERFAGKQMILTETLQLVKGYSRKETPPSFRMMAQMPPARLAYHDCRGYWIVRYLEENHPGFLKSILSEHRYEDEIADALAETLGLERKDLWVKIDDVITGYYLDEQED